MNMWKQRPSRPNRMKYQKQKHSIYSNLLLTLMVLLHEVASNEKFYLQYEVF